MNRRCKLTGGHSTLGNVRIDEIIKKYANGVYEAKISVRDPSNSNNFISKSNNQGKATMFPSSWTADRIKAEVSAAYNNKIVEGNKWKGVTPSGVKVEGWLNPKTTVYPSKNQ